MKNHEGSLCLRKGVARLSRPALTCMLASVMFSPALLDAKPAVRNLGGGLEELATQAGQTQSRASARVPLAQVTHPIQFDEAGRALVRISLDGKVPAANVLQSVRGMAGVEVVASDFNYRAGVIEAYVPTGSLVSLAGQKGVLARPECRTSPRQATVRRRRAMTRSRA
jgi:hypothetical protein